ncbi:MAG: hypothetical protein ACLQLH_03540 [Terracidiphilus sp.]
MPLIPGKSNAVVGKNIAELHTGKTFAHTKAKFGKDKANKQAVAIALDKAGKGNRQPPPASHPAPPVVRPRFGAAQMFTRRPQPMQPPPGTGAGAIPGQDDDDDDQQVPMRSRAIFGRRGR